MRTTTVRLLRCPNAGGALELYAWERDGDDAVAGVLADLEAGTAYPVAGSVALLLADRDTEVERHAGLLRAARPRCPEPFRRAVDRTLERLEARPETDEGTWNREEMEYYGRSVATETMRENKLRDIRSRPQWNIFLPRRRYLTGPLAGAVKGKYLLEAGCSAARTISWILPPERHDYRYVGFDISWEQVQLAKRVVPAGDFLQASAMNPPFRRGVFHALLGFGVFHHLPSPGDGLRRCLETVADNGWVGLHEPIRTPKLFREGSRGRKLVERWFGDYEHSEHDNDIDLEETLATLRERNPSAIDVSFSHSPARVILNRLCRLFKGPSSSLWAYRVAIGLDKLVLQTAGRLSPRLGPRAASVLARPRVPRAG